MQRQNPLLLWFIVGGCAFVIFSFWIFSIRDEVSAFSQSLKSGFSVSSNHVVDAWNQADSVAKKLSSKTEQPAALSDEQLARIASGVKEMSGQPLEMATLPVNKEATTPSTEANPVRQFCTASGGNVVTVTAKDKSIYNVCQFVDGTECEVGAFYRKECRKGQFVHVTSGETDLSDLIPEVTRADYCKMSGDTWEWMSKRAGATHVCFDTVIVRNQASAVAPASTVTIGSVSYPIPSLGYNEGYKLKSPSPVKIVEGMTEVNVKVDASEKIKEKDEDNNIAVFLVGPLK